MGGTSSKPKPTEDDSSNGFPRNSSIVNARQFVDNSQQEGIRKDAKGQAGIDAAVKLSKRVADGLKARIDTAAKPVAGKSHEAQLAELKGLEEEAREINKEITESYQKMGLAIPDSLKYSLKPIANQDPISCDILQYAQITKALVNAQHHSAAGAKKEAKQQQVPASPESRVESQAEGMDHLRTPPRTGHQAGGKQGKGGAGGDSPADIAGAAHRFTMGMGKAQGSPEQDDDEDATQSRAGSQAEGPPEGYGSDADTSFTVPTFGSGDRD